MKTISTHTVLTFLLSRIVILPLVFLPTGLRAGDTLPKAAAQGNESAAPAHHSFLDPVDDFVRDDILHPVSPFVVVPGKDPSGWSFTIEPYLWAMGMNGKIGVRGDPPSTVHESAKSVLQHLDWGIFAKAEVRKDRWGLLADGFFAQLSASGDSDSSVYRSLDATVQQGMASLALAYRVVDDRRGFLDVYAGARYNYFGLTATATLNTEVIQSISEAAADEIAADIRSKVEDVVTDKLEKLKAGRRGTRLPDRLANRLRQALAARIRAKTAPEVAKAQAAIANAKKKLAKAIAEKITDELSTQEDGSEWWVDPIIGLRGQINFTRWLYLAAQSDVGGFYAGSRIAWNAQATLGVNFTRNIFGELGYRYFSMDYNKSGTIYDVAEFGIYSSIGVKF